MHVRPAIGSSSHPEFAIASNLVRALHRVTMGTGAKYQIDVLRGDEATYRKLAQAFSAAEADFARVSPAKALWELPVYGFTHAEGDDSLAHIFNWLWVQESRDMAMRALEKRADHEWGLGLVDGQGIRLHFKHGKFGLRHELHDRWSTALVRLAELVTGNRTWHEFGDPKSQATLLNKGQFFWTDPKSGEAVPLANFVFVTSTGDQFTLAGALGRSVLSVDYALPPIQLLGDGDTDTPTNHEWFDDYSHALMRMAEVLGGQVDLAQFSRGPLGANPCEYDRAAGRLQPENAGFPNLSVGGRFVVKDIGQVTPVIDAPSLSFMTREGVQVQLQQEPLRWCLRLIDFEGHTAEAVYEAAELPAALRQWAYVLQTGQLS